MENIKLKDFTSMGIGGVASLIRLSSHVEADSIWKSVKNEIHFILSGGSNLLVADQLGKRICIKIEIDKIEFTTSNDKVFVSVGAGVNFDKLVEQVSNYGLTGFEVLSGIPGLVGASPVQNIGAYGSDVSEYIHSLNVYDTKSEKYCELEASQCDFGYRSSIFNSTAKGQYWILGVNFAFDLINSVDAGHRDIVAELGQESCSDSTDLRNAILAIRHKKGMLAGDNYPKSAGSFFKNPIITIEQYQQLKDRFDDLPSFSADNGIKVPAAWLIGNAGFPKGATYKGVGISPYHNLSLINLGEGTFLELMELTNNIIEAVDQKFHIELHVEPEMVR